MSITSQRTDTPETPFPARPRFVENTRTKRAYWVSDLIEPDIKQHAIPWHTHDGEKALREYIQTNGISLTEHDPTAEDLGIDSITTTVNPVPPPPPILDFTTQVAHYWDGNDDAHPVRTVCITVANQTSTFARETEADLTINRGKTVTLFKKRDIYKEGEGLLGAVAILINYDRDKKEIVIPYVERKISDEVMVPKEEKFQDINNLPCPIDLTLRGDNLRLEDRKPKNFMLWREQKTGELRFGTVGQWGDSVREGKPHMALDGKTPGEAAGITIQGDNKWITLIQNAVRVPHLTAGDVSR